MSRKAMIDQLIVSRSGVAKNLLNFTLNLPIMMS